MSSASLPHALPSHFSVAPDPPVCVQTGEWVLVLEGLCRVSVTSTRLGQGSNSPSAPPSGAPSAAAFELAQVTQLELTPPPASQPSLGGAGGGGGADAQAVQQLGAQLKATTRAFLRLLTKQAGRRRGPAGGG